jgi:Zn-dependent protease
MVFVPFMGAFVTAKGFGRNLTQDAFIGIMGPVVGTLASVVTALIYIPTGDPFWLALASWGFFINLFNLLPTPPLDGGWITPLFSPKLLALGMVIAVAVGFLNPLIWLLLIVSLPRVISGWKADPKTQPYYQVAVADKWKFGVAYIGLAGFLALAGYTVQRILIAKGIGS